MSENHTDIICENQNWRWSGTLRDCDDLYSYIKEILNCSKHTFNGKNDKISSDYSNHNDNNIEIYK